MRINWSWVKHRLRMVTRCRHQWDHEGDGVGHICCARCGTWRWFPTFGRPPR